MPARGRVGRARPNVRRTEGEGEEEQEGEAEERVAHFAPVRAAAAEDPAIVNTGIVRACVLPAGAA